MKLGLGRWAGDQPTIIEVWAPSCVECRAMQSDIDFAVAEFAGLVRLASVNAASEPELARSLGAMATPTLIGVSAGNEVFRVVGRRTRSELQELFRAVAAGEAAPEVGRQDRILRAGAGLSLVIFGALSGPVWPLVGIGGAVAAWGVASRRESRRG